MSVPNQKIVIINKKKYVEKFLQIGIAEWQEACKKLKSLSAFCLYLYLAGNSDKFKLELSKEAFENATGFKKTSYHDGLKKLQDLGYLVHAGGNKWLFYTSPVRFGGEEGTIAKTDFRTNGNKHPENRMVQSAKTNNLVRSSNTEIDNIDKLNKIDNKPLASDCLEDVSREEIKMYTKLDKLFPLNVYSAEDEERIGDLLLSECYWDVPQERLSQMSKAEREMMAAYYRKYAKYMWRIK